MNLEKIPSYLKEHASWCNKELNAEIIRTFIEKVYVYGNKKPWDRNTKKIKIIFNFIGEAHIPTNVKTA